MNTQAALAVDIRGLAKLVERRGKSFAILELVQNAWDEDGVTTVAVVLTYESYNRATLTVEDDSPNGFHDLSHAYTLFAESAKKTDPTKRGRFNLGEKLVIALADSFTVHTTKGGVEIDVSNNTRRMLRKVRERGSIIGAMVRMTRAEVEEALRAFHTLIPPTGITTTINGTPLANRDPVTMFTATLATEVADEDGYLRPTRRQTSVEIYRPLEGEEATLYELGIPVVATGDTFHVNVMQKVPLNSDRDNVTPSYLRDVRALVLNQVADNLDAEEATASWVNEALEDELVSSEAVTRIVTARYGERRVAWDPSDQEANRLAMASGYSVIPGRSLSGAAWSAVKAAGAVLPAGQVTPSPKPYSADGEPLKVIPRLSWRPGMQAMETFAQRLAEETLRRQITVEFANDALWPFEATFGESGRLTFNVGRLGYAFFELPHDHERVLDLLIHEFAHYDGASHLSKQYDGNLSKIGARFARTALTEPSIFE